jgi:hypothetical protein
MPGDPNDLDADDFLDDRWEPSAEDLEGLNAEIEDSEANLPSAGEVAPVQPTESHGGAITHRRNIGTTEAIDLHVGPRMKVKAKATLIYKSDGTPRSVSLEIIRSARASIQGIWAEDAPRIRIEGAEVEKLFSYIQEQRAALPQVGDVEYIFMPVRGTGGSIDLRGLAGLIERVASDPESFRPLVEMVGTGRLRALRAAANLGRFEQGKLELEALVARNALEADLQKWFEANPWAFGSEYVKLIDGRILSPTSAIDLLFETADGFADIFELKRADVPVLVRAPGRSHLQPSADLNAAFAQGVRYLADATDMRLYNLQRRDIHIYQPRVRLVIGRSAGWDDEHRRAFRDLTEQWHAIDVLTYDMVLARIDLLIATMAREARTPQGS